MMSKPILQTIDLSIGYINQKREQVLADRINLMLHPGQLTAVLGINGIGKSSLLRTLSGVQPPLKGKIIAASKELQKIDPREQAALISLVLTEQPFSRNLSVAELVSLGRHPFTNWIGKMSPADLEQVEKALDLVGISTLSERRCHTLSDGQLQKAMVARAVAQDTPLMILDEPTSHLDLYHKAQVLKLLRNLSSSTGKSILLATHEINLALQLCDQIILMKPQVHQGSPEELLSAGAFENLFPRDLILFDESTRSFRIKT